MHWEQKAKMDWMTKGDKNIDFFQALVIKRRAFNKIIGIQKEDDTITKYLGEMKRRII